MFIGIYYRNVYRNLCEEIARLPSFYSSIWPCLHVGGEITRGDYTFTMSAEVGLLTRNIKIVGENYTRLIQDSFGARVLIGKYTDSEDGVHIGMCSVFGHPN